MDTAAIVPQLAAPGTLRSDSRLSSPASVRNGAVPHLDAESPEYANGAMESDHSGSDVDAEGSEDDEYVENPAATDNHDDIHNAPSPGSLSGSSSSSKRKRGDNFDEQEHIRLNPEIYGLRRSGRQPKIPSAALGDSASGDDSDSDVVAPRKKKRRNNIITSKRPTPSDVANSDSDEFFTNKKMKAKKPKSLSAMSLSMYQRNPDRSTRKKNEVNYVDQSAEDDEDDVLEWEEEGMLVEEDNSLIIGEVLDFQIIEGATYDQADLDIQHFRFLIKWEFIAHYHAAWMSWDELKPLKGNRKVINYFRDPITPWINMQNGHATVDEKEEQILNLEKKRAEYKKMQQIERVIGQQYQDTGTEYFVKWKSVEYAGCTWEIPDVINLLAPEALEDYLERSERQVISDRTLSNTRSLDVPVIKKQPDYIENGTLRDFQIVGLNYLIHNWARRTNVILADEMGLGKTVQTVAFLSWLFNYRKQAGPFLVVVPLSTLPAWQDTFALWSPTLNVVTFTGKSTSKAIIESYELLTESGKPKFNVLLTTYEHVKDARVTKFDWQYIAIDEAHRLKNRFSQIYTTLINLNIPNKLLITGTPMQNSVEELCALMDFLNPGFIDAPEDPDTMSPEMAAVALEKFNKDIRPLMLRRVKKDVVKDLPPKTEQILRVPLSSLQIEYYQALLTKNYQFLNSPDSSQKQSLLNMMMELKKCSNHPFLLAGAQERLLGDYPTDEDYKRGMVTSSGKMMLLDTLLKRQKQDGHRVLVFSQLVSMLNILGDYLRLNGHKYQRLDGTVSAEDRRTAIEHFNAPGSDDFVFLLSTRAGGLGINLMTADTVILFDSDWNPHSDIQAIARAHRIGQTKPVSVFRFVSEHTVEEEVLDRARKKLLLEQIIIQSGIMDDEQKKMMKKNNKLIDAPSSSEEISEMLKRRSVKMFEQNDNQNKLEQLDLDALLATAEQYETEETTGIRQSDGGLDFMSDMITSVKFEGGWDTIIPAEKIKQYEAEKEKEEAERATKKVLEDNKPRKRDTGFPDEDKTQRSAKRKAKRNAAAQAAAQKDDSDDASGDSDDSEDERTRDPKRPFEPKDWRNFLRACEKYGSFFDDDVQPKVIKEARMVGRDIEVMKAAYSEIANKCRETIQNHRDKQATENNAPQTKKEQKAVLMELHGVKRINCATFLQRAEDLKMIRDAVNKHITEMGEISTFRLSDAEKKASYDCEWELREDGMLLAGMARHGFGGWAAIRDDPDLRMKDRMFLEENRTENKKQRGEDQAALKPGAVHLVRRANYLIDVMKDPKGAENHHRNLKKAAKERLSTKAKYDDQTGSGTPISHKLKKADRPRADSQTIVVPSIERPDSRASDQVNGHRRKAHDEGDREHKRIKLSSENTPDSRRQTSHALDKPEKDRSHKHADKDRERARKRDEAKHRRPVDKAYLIRDDRDRDRYGDRSPRPNDRKSDYHARNRSRSPTRRHEDRKDIRREYNDHHRKDERRRLDVRTSAYIDDRRRPRDDHGRSDYSRPRDERGYNGRDRYDDKDRNRSHHNGYTDDRYRKDDRHHKSDHHRSDRRDDDRRHDRKSDNHRSAASHDRPPATPVKLDANPQVIAVFKDGKANLSETKRLLDVAQAAPREEQPPKMALFKESLLHLRAFIVKEAGDGQGKPTLDQLWGFAQHRVLPKSKTDGTLKNMADKIYAASTQRPQ